MNPPSPMPHAGRRRATALAALAVTMLALAPAAGAALVTGPVTIPDQDTPVIDTADVLDAATREKLVDWLHELKDKTHAQIKVLTVPSLADEEIFSFAQRHFDLWKLGEKGKNNGVLIVLAPIERKIRIQTGYGLEGALPDSWCGTATRQVAKKYFVQGEYSKGLAELTQAVVQRVATDAGVKIGDLPAAPMRDETQVSLSDVLPFVVFAIVIAWILYSSWKNRGGRRRWRSTQPGWGWSGLPTGGWSSGGGSSGGGGWSGGGGDFGGGGSSGGGGGGASW